MVLTGYRLIHVAAYTYRRKFTVNDKPDPKPRTKKAAKAPGKRRGAKKKAGGYNFAVPSTGKRVTYV